MADSLLPGEAVLILCRGTQQHRAEQESDHEDSNCDFSRHERNVGMNLPGRRPYTSPGTWSSFHKDGAHTLMADGAVRFLNKNTDPQVLKALLTATGGETVGEF